MQLSVQKSTRTTDPRSPAGVRGSELSHSVAPSNDGTLPSYESSACSSVAIRGGSRFEVVDLGHARGGAHGSRPWSPWFKPWTARPHRTVSSGRRGCGGDAIEPALDRGNHVLPALGRHQQVRPALELEVIGLRR